MINSSVMNICIINFMLVKKSLFLSSSEGREMVSLSITDKIFPSKGMKCPTSAVSAMTT